MKRPGAKKDEMKLALLKLKSYIQKDQRDHTDGGGAAVLEEKTDNPESSSISNSRDSLSSENTVTKNNDTIIM